MSELLDQLARARGIGDSYHDYRGEYREISLQTKSAILAAMGCDVTSDEAIAAELQRLSQERWGVLLPPVSILRPGSHQVFVAVDTSVLTQPMRWTVSCADGLERAGRVLAGDLTEVERHEHAGRVWTRRVLPLPEDLPAGYHSLEASLDDGTVAESTLLVAPTHCHEPEALREGRRLWGLSVQLYTLRSSINWGIGDFADLEFVVRESARYGAGFVGLNPLHALFPANPDNFSPYSASSRHFINVMYIAVPRVPDFAHCPEARRLVESDAFVAELARARAATHIDYAAVARTKLAVLRLLFDHFRREHLQHETERARAFQAFVAERGELLRLHALHDALDEHFRALDAKHWGWPVWPEEFRDPQHASVARFAVDQAVAVQFHQWLQWIANEQLATVQARATELGMPIGLYGDFAVGVNPNGSEIWSDQAVYRMQCSIGAPPDELALKGQDWGLPPLDPHALLRARCRPFRNLIAANMRHYGALRLDHVMALFRQWWVPAGLSSTHGGYVHYPLDALMAVLVNESAGQQCLVVGEDLGTVPEQMRHAMAANAVYHYKVLMFEKEWDGSFRAPDAYVRRAIATVVTHDMPTVRGYWESRDLKLRTELGLFPNEQLARDVQAERLRDRVQLLDALDKYDLRHASTADGEQTFHSAITDGLHLYLARTASALAVLQIEDLIGMVDPVNVPGTNTEYPNWRRKITASIEDVFNEEGVVAILAQLNQVRQAPCN
jgi:4-alpha-glucanotransferase